MSIKKYIYLTFLLSFLLITPSIAHEWYPYACCSDKDCHPVACEDILEKGKNLVYHDYPFFGDMIKPSKDGDCHVCISNENGTEGYTPVPHCIFIQQGS